MPGLQIRSADGCRYDMVALGEVMLRLDPGDVRIHTARSFRAWEGGGEYNVARGLRRCFGLRTAIVTALADNPVGGLIEDLMLQGGVDVSQVRWVRSDGAGRHVRNGLNFTERGFGVRGALGVSDRGHTAASQLRPGDVDWEQIFGTAGTRWFHTGGIFAALSASTPDVAEEAMRAARRHGAVVSYDLNYRPSLWADYGGQDRAQEVNRSLVGHADVLFGNEEDFTAALGFDVPATAADFADLQAGNFQKMITSVTREFGQLRVVATTLRTATTASVNDWGAIAWADGRFYQATYRPGLAIMDRVGGGDSFASGLIFGLMETGDPAMAVEYGAAHGALSMTTPGDTSMATRAEVAALVRGAGRTGAAVNRPARGTGLPPCHAGIDVGTSAVKAVLVEPDGRVSARSRVPLPADAGGERDSLDWLDGTRAALAQLPDQERARVCSVGLTGLTPGTVLVDEAGHPTGPALTWQHSAATAEAAELAARFGDTAELLGTSLPWGPGYPPAQLAWLARRRPQARAATRWVLQAKDFVGMALTGSPASDRWSSKGICNVLTGASASAILRAAGWDPAVCPPTAEPWEPRGTVTAEASDRFGIPAGVPVSVGWSDALGGMLALGVFERSRAFAILGTSCIAGVSLALGSGTPGSGTPGSGAVGSGLLNVPATVAPLALAYGPTQNGGSALDWLAALTGRDVPELMDLSERADPAATPVFAPYLAGERAPLWEAGARGVLTGLVTATGAPELARATLRGIAATVRNVIEHAEQAAGTRYSAVIVGGSLAGHPAWLTAAHEVLGREFSVADDEPSGYGAAMLGASAAGFSLPHLAARAARPLAGAASADESFAQFIAATDVSLAAVRQAAGRGPG